MFMLPTPAKAYSDKSTDTISPKPFSAAPVNERPGETLVTPKLIFPVNGVLTCPVKLGSSAAIDMFSIIRSAFCCADSPPINSASI